MNKKRLVWIVIFLIGFIVRSTHIFQPIDTDSWREADVATMAKNFYQNGTDIFHPQIAYGGSGPGYVESEFQLYSYLIATSYKIFGFWEPTGRVISFLFSLATMLVFFRLSEYLLDSRAAIVSSLFFSVSPILMVMSVAIQPETLMFFFYVCSAYTFIRWLDGDSKKFYWLTIIFTALALLCKITSANIGFFFLVLIINNKGWKFLLKPKVIILGALSIIPAALWYWYGHRFYVLYGNSLGISNQYSFIGWDFFTSRKLITGLIKNEVSNVWTLAGPFIILLALIYTKVIKKEGFLSAFWWFAAASLFYIIISRSAAENWAWYYHIFSIPSASILLGISVVELYNNYFQKVNLSKTTGSSRDTFMRKRIIGSLFLLSISFFFLFTFIYLTTTKPSLYKTSKFYSCKERLKQIIPKDSLILTNGGQGRDEFGNSLAYEIGYFFYWLDRKGFSIKIEDLSVQNILSFKENGAAYFVAEEDKIKSVPGLDDELKKNFKPIFEYNGCILFKL